jgi:hypothetical protein
MIKKLVLQLLDTDEGITESAYSQLLDYLASINEFELLENINNMVQSCNGRRYLL